MTSNMKSKSRLKKKRRHDWLFATLHTLVVVFLCFVLLICLCVCLFYIDQDNLVTQQARYKITLTCIVVV